MKFDPPCCPFATCPSRATAAPFRFHRSGVFRRRCDRRVVPRFLCLACRRRFSAQTFRLDYGWRKPEIDTWTLNCLVSKVTHRQAARLMHVDRKSIERRLRRFAPALHELHQDILRRARGRGGLRGSFSMDELETFEGNRRLQPVTVPVVIERHTHFVCHVETASLPARGRLGARERKRLKAQSRGQAPRRSGSSAAVDQCLKSLSQLHDPRRLLELVTDQKRTYRTILRRHFPQKVGAHITESSRRTRNRANPMFAINHTLAMMRDQVSRLVRRSWGASKCRHMLLKHIWVWMAWRNYVRPITNQAPLVTPATALLIAPRQLSVADLLRWRWPALMNAYANQRGQFLSVGV
jgi:transposase-like protein